MIIFCLDDWFSVSSVTTKGLPGIYPSVELLYDHKRPRQALLTENKYTYIYIYIYIRMCMCDVCIYMYVCVCV